MTERLLLPPEGFRTRGPVPTGARVLLIRHGEAVCNAEGIVGGVNGDGGLTDLGREQAAALRRRLEHSGELRGAVGFYCSHLPRAKETADLLAAAVGAGAPAIVDHTLAELEPGEADGLTWNEVVDRYGIPDWDEDPTVPVAPGGESWTGFAERCFAALTAISARHPHGLTVAVSHGGVVEHALKLVYGQPAPARLRLRTENCSMTEIELREGRWHLLRYNDRAPLPADPPPRAATAPSEG